MAKMANDRLLQRGDFVRVRSDLDDPAAGSDGMVIKDQDSEGHVGLMFHYGRSGDLQRYGLGIPEDWHVSELDLSSIDR